MPGRMEFAATQTKPAYAGLKKNLILVREGGLGLCSRDFNRPVKFC
jgi:hypothetical protein